MRHRRLLTLAAIGIGTLLPVITLQSSAAAADAAPAPVKVGAYYFDGWTGQTYHITERLKNEFADREPVWGWKDDTLEIMEQQIDYAANAGLSFWSFCWYWPENGKPTPLNNALDLYLKAKNRARLQFCLLVANHGGYRIGPKEWPALRAAWIPLLRQPTALTVDGKPLIIFFSPSELLKAFGTPEAVKAAFDQLRADADAAGLKGVCIGTCATPGPVHNWSNLEQLRACGFDLFTGYNYTYAGTVNTNTKKQTFANMIPGHEEVWNGFAERGQRLYIPAVTTGWDKRPWEALDLPLEKQSRYYPDRSPELVGDMTRRAIDWVRTHPSVATPEKYVILYAWNENGEGGFITPTKAEGSVYLDAIKQAIKSSSATNNSTQP